MKKIIFLISLFNLVFFCANLHANNSLSLKNFLEKKNIDDPETQIYLLNRCSAVYVYASAIILKSDAVKSKKFIDVANNLLFKSVELSFIDYKQKLEEAQKKAELERKNLFEDYALEGKKNWKKNNSYFKGSYISEDMLICEKLVEEK